MSTLARRRLGRIAVFAALVALVGCSHVRPPRPDAGNSSSSAQIITRQEIDSLMTQHTNVYELIQHIRPNMLKWSEARLPYSVREGLVSEPVGIKVFVDANYVGGVDMLRRIPSRAVVFVQRLSPSDATTRYGSEMVAGAIVITTGTRWR